MFLERILSEKRKEVKRLKTRQPPNRSFRHADERRSLAEALARGNSPFGLIAEVKKASPSKGVIRRDFDPAALAQAYEAAGAQAISVLTDRSFFQGDLRDLKHIREVVNIPLLRKDFIIDPVQIDESAAAGADAILLIAAALTPEQMHGLSHYAQEKGLEVLIEIHTEDELSPAIAAAPNVLGINNRDLHTFDVSLDVTRRLAPQIPTDVPVISESGISHPGHIQELKRLGLKGMLVGEFLMRQDDVAEGIRYLRGIQSHETDR